MVYQFKDTEAIWLKVEANHVGFGTPERPDEFEMLAAEMTLINREVSDLVSDGPS